MIKSFECFRLIGTILVFICHITLFDLSIGGGVPVEMFFVLSGFGMMLGYGNDSIKFIPYMKNASTVCIRYISFPLFSGLFI